MNSPTSLLYTTRQYPCGCRAEGTGDVPNYCPEHEAPIPFTSNERTARALQPNPYEKPHVSTDRLLFCIEKLHSHVMTNRGDLATSWIDELTLLRELLRLRESAAETGTELEQLRRIDKAARVYLDAAHGQAAGDAWEAFEQALYDGRPAPRITMERR